MGLYMRKAACSGKVEKSWKAEQSFNYWLLLLRRISFPKKQIFMNIIIHKLSFMLFVREATLSEVRCIHGLLPSFSQHLIYYTQSTRKPGIMTWKICFYWCEWELAEGSVAALQCFVPLRSLSRPADGWLPDRGAFYDASCFLLTSSALSSSTETSVKFPCDLPYLHSPTFLHNKNIILCSRSPSSSVRPLNTFYGMHLG